MRMFNRDSDKLFCTNKSEGSHRYAVHYGAGFYGWQSLGVGGHVGVVFVSVGIVSGVSIADVIAVKTFVVRVGVGVVSGVIFASIGVVNCVGGITIVVQTFVILAVSVFAVAIRVIALVGIVVVGVGVVAVVRVSRVCVHFEYLIINLSHT